MQRQTTDKKHGTDLPIARSLDHEEEERSSPLAIAEDYVGWCRAELALLDPVHSPVDWANAQRELGEALFKLSSIECELSMETVGQEHSLQGENAWANAERVNPTPSSNPFAKNWKTDVPLELARDDAKMRRGIESIETVRDKSIITRNGIRYLPLPRAAAIAQASESAIKKWVASRIKFGGYAIGTYKSITKDIYISEESAEEMAQRFVRWPSNSPAGPVVLGETDDQSGFIGLTDAARILQVGHHTVWLWVTQGKAPSARSLDVIKCTVSDYLYIRERDLSELKSTIPRSGLRRGRRPRAIAEPS